MAAKLDKRASGKRPRKKAIDCNSVQTLRVPAALKSDSISNRQAAVVVAIGLAFCIGVAQQWEPLNGLAQLTRWEWSWRALGILKTGTLLLTPFALIAWLLRRLEKNASTRYPYVLLALLTLSNFLLQILGIMADPRGGQLVQRIVISPGTTSYFRDAMQIDGLVGWLGRFDQIPLNFHSQTHPPGPILFYYLFTSHLSPAMASLLGGCAVGLVGSFGVVIMYAFAGLWTEDRRTRMIASAYYALMPALILFFPEFDQAYPILSMLMILVWVRALNMPQARQAILTGIVLFAATFFAYNLLAIGAFLTYYTIYWLWREHRTPQAYRKLRETAVVGLGVCAGLYTVLWATTGYNPIAAFRRALGSQAIFANNLKRPYGIFALLDPYDFFLGAGIIAIPILLFVLIRLRSQFDARKADSVLTLIALATIATVDISGLLRGETARVWLFLQPLVIVPVALELSRVPWLWRLAIFAVQWGIVVCLKAKMLFVDA